MIVEELEQTAPELNQPTAADLFAERMLGVLNSGALTLMISIGHRTRLFDTMAALAPSTSVRIAEAAKLNERYVREWLGAMVTGRIVEYNQPDATYSLPPEHAAFLTRAASPNNLAAPMQFISLLGSVEDQIIECFRRGGGLPYSAFPRFHEVMAEESGQTVAAGLFDFILPLVPGLIERLREGINVLDVGCGRGHTLNLLAEAFPKSRFVGYDFSGDALAEGYVEAKRAGLRNVRFEMKDAAMLDDVERFDLITAFDAIHDQARPARVLEGINRALKPEGVFLMQDIAGSSHVHNNLDHPLAPFFYTISCMHCMTVSLALEGEGLGTMWGQEKAREMLADAGFTRVEMKQLPHDIQNYYYVATKS
ncbi:MAG TPA: class I SAM-dependent methyltransferase [Pyrinomonadaceae bacterium]|jgi:ubiquinone/menaquinone biosynthesis C-methylase UbiE